MLDLAIELLGLLYILFDLILLLLSLHCSGVGLAQSYYLVANVMLLVYVLKVRVLSET